MYIFGVRKSIQNFMDYGELGRSSLDIQVKCRIINFKLAMADTENT